MKKKHVFAIKIILTFLIYSVGSYVSSAKADTELDALRSSLDRLKKENSQLKADNKEKDNLAKRLENENARLKADRGISHKTATSPFNYKSTTSDGSYNKLNRLHSSSSTNSNPDQVLSIVGGDQFIPLTSVIFSVEQWNGFYGGINAGYGGGDLDYSGVSYPWDMSNGALKPGFPSSFLGYERAGGAIAGGQIGYNYIFPNNIMFGGEVDVDWADIAAKGDQRDKYVDLTNGSTSQYFWRDGLDWIGTARMRLGYALGQFIPYITGGISFGKTSTQINTSTLASYDFNGLNALYYSPANGNISNTSIGWVVGAGVEYMPVNKISIKTEYLYTQLPGLTQTSSSNDYGSIEGLYSGTHQVGMLGSLGFHQVRFGINYHTGWGASAPAISTKD